MTAKYGNNIWKRYPYRYTIVAAFGRRIQNITSQSLKKKPFRNSKLTSCIKWRPKAAGYKTIFQFFFSKIVLFSMIERFIQKRYNLSTTKKKKPFRNSKWTSCIKWRPSAAGYKNNIPVFLFQNGFLFQWLRGRFIFPKVILPIFKRTNYFTTQKYSIKSFKEYH